MKSGVTAWPDGSRIAVALTVMFESWPEGKWPPMSAQMHKLLRYFSGRPGVWFARHRELAQWALEGDCDEISNAQRFFPEQRRRRA